MCILLLLDEKFSVYLLSPICSDVLFKADVPLLIFCPDDLPTDEGGVLLYCCLFLPLGLLIFALYI